MDTFRGKVALITGGGTGIGEATAIAFAREGARVVVASRREEPLVNVVAKIKKVGEPPVAFSHAGNDGRHQARLARDEPDDPVAFAVGDQPHHKCLCFQAGHGVPENQNIT